MNTKTKQVLAALTFVLSACTGGLNDPLGGQPTATVQAAQATYTPLPTYTPYPTQTPQNSATPVPPPPATVAPTSTPTIAATVVTGAIAGPTLKRTGTLFETPVKCTAKFNNESKWLVCEPGVLLNNTTAWTIGQVKATYYVNIPEGGFTYFSLGEGTITIDKVELVLKGEQGLNYLVLVRGKIDDGVMDSDLNMTAEVTNFVPGHAIWSHMPTGAYVSKDWFKQQLVASSTGSFTNCGATGCSRVRIVLYDVSSRTYQMFEVQAKDLDNWKLLESN